MSAVTGSWLFLSRSERTARRGEALARLAGLVERGVPLPSALLAVADGSTGRARRQLLAAAAGAGEGGPLMSALSTAELVEPGEQALLQALTGADPARTLLSFAEDLRGRAQLEAEIERGLGAPLRHALGLVAVVVGFGVLGGMGLEVIQRALGAGGGGGSWSLVLALGVPLLAWVWFERVGLSRLVRSPWLDVQAASFPVLQRLLTLHTASTFLRRLGLCLAAGRPLPAALEAAGAGFGARPAGVQAQALARHAREGASLSQCLGEASFLDPSAELLALAAAQRADPPRELLELARVYADELTIEARGLGPVLGGCAEVAVLLPLGAVLARVLAGLEDSAALMRMMF